MRCMTQFPDLPGTKKRLKAVQMLALGHEVPQVALYVGYAVADLRSMMRDCEDFKEALEAERRHTAKSMEQRLAQSELSVFAALDRGLLDDRIGAILILAKATGFATRGAGRGPRTREEAFKRAMDVVAAATPEQQREFYAMSDQASSSGSDVATAMPLYRPYVNEAGEEEYYDVEDDPDLNEAGGIDPTTIGPVTVNGSSDLPRSTQQAEERSEPVGSSETTGGEVRLRYPKEPLPYHLRAPDRQRR
ncbi:MAG: hypothetical protein U1E45_13000 [Geminicoccaceae bacterium]